MRDRIDYLAKALEAAKSPVAVQIDQTMSLMVARADGHPLSRAWSTSPMPARAFHTDGWSRLEGGRKLDHSMLVAQYPCPQKDGQWRIPVFFDEDQAMRTGVETFVGPVILAVPDRMVVKGGPAPLDIALAEIRKGQKALACRVLADRSWRKLLSPDGVSGFDDFVYRAEQAIKIADDNGVGRDAVLDWWECECGPFLDIGENNLDWFIVWMSHMEHGTDYWLGRDVGDMKLLALAEGSVSGSPCLRFAIFGDDAEIRAGTVSMAEIGRMEKAATALFALSENGHDEMRDAAHVAKTAWEAARDTLGFSPEDFIAYLRRDSFNLVCGKIPLLNEWDVKDTGSLYAGRAIPLETAVIGYELDDDRGILLVAESREGDIVFHLAKASDLLERHER